MREKIVEALKAKFPKLSQSRIDSYADKLATKITEEKDIDARIDDLNDVVDFDAIIKLDAKVAKLELEKKEAKKKTPPKEKDEEDETDEEEETEVKPKKAKTPAYMKELMDTVKNLATDVSSMKAEKSQTTIKQQATEQLKDIPAVFWSKRSMPDKVDDLEAFVTDVKADYATLEKQETDKGFSLMSKPKSGDGDASKKPSEKEVDAILDNIKY